MHCLARWIIKLGRASHPDRRSIPIRAQRAALTRICRLVPTQDQSRMNDENAPWIAGSDCIAASLHTLSRRPLWVGRPTCHRGEMERSKHLHLCLPDLGSKPNDTAAPVNVWFTHRPIGRTAQISEGARLAGSKAFRLFNARSCEATKLDRQTKTAYKKEPRWLCKQQDCCGYTPALRRCISRN